MEENKFEKQIQQKMDELKIHPSDSVWEKIAIRLERKKRPNRGILLFLLLFCVFLAGGYFLWNTGQHLTTEGNNSEKNYSEKSIPGIPEIKSNNNSVATNKADPGIKIKKINTVGNGPIKNNINKNSSLRYQLPFAKKIIKINSGENATVVFSKQQEIKEEISENIYPKPGIVQPGEILPENEKINPGIKDSTDNTLNKDVLSNLVSSKEEKANVKDTLKKMQASSETTKHTKKNKWKPGLLFSGGISGVGNNFLGLVNSRSYADLNANGGQAGGPGTIPLAPPSKTKSGFGFMAGVFAERNISAKASLVLGINFKSFNTSNKVGTRNDTTGLFDSRNTVNSYNNHYNFIELPVTLKIRIGRGKNMPLFWQGGLVVSELISSNALQFNPNSGLYYSDNSIFNKTQIGLNTSLSAALFSKQKNSILIGPYFYYSATGLANEGLYNNKHFVFTGLRTEIIFGK
jgi:hypothetical protein